MECLQCGKETNNPKFCSRSCSTSFNNCGVDRHNNKNKKELAIILRKESKGYRTIAKELGMSCSTVRNWTKHIKTDRRLTIRNSRELVPIPQLVSSSQVRKRLLEERGSICELCGIVDWLDKEITFEVHHLDGDGDNNNLENLQVLCPNCHSQTPDYRNNTPV